MAECEIPAAAPTWIPEWVFCPQERILSVVVEWIVGGFIVAGNWIVETIATPFDEFQNALELAGASVWDAGGTVSAALYGMAFEVNNAILDVAGSAGPAAPVVTVVLYSGVTVVFIASLRGLVRLYKAVRVWLI